MSCVCCTLGTDTRDACTCTVRMMSHSGGGGGEKEKGGGVRVAHQHDTAERSGWQAAQGQQHEQERCVLSLFFFFFFHQHGHAVSAQITSARSLTPPLPLPPSLSSLGLAQVESMLSSCAADHGHHAMHACQWPTPPHRLAMSVAAPLLHAVVWKEGCPPTVRVCACVCHTLLHPPLCIQCVWVHTFVC